jgi:hypothetical protein
LRFSPSFGRCSLLFDGTFFAFFPIRPIPVLRTTAAAKKYDRSGCDWVSWGGHASQEYQEKFATGRAKYGPGRYKRVLVNFGKVALVKSFGKFRLNGFG